MTTYSTQAIKILYVVFTASSWIKSPCVSCVECVLCKTEHLDEGWHSAAEHFVFWRKKPSSDKQCETAKQP